MNPSGPQRAARPAEPVPGARSPGAAADIRAGAAADGRVGAQGSTAFAHATGRAVHVAGVAVGLMCAIVAGAVLGGPWWVAAAVAGAGAVSGRNGALVQAVATVAIAGGAASSDVEWLVPLLVLGVVATVEAGAVPEHRTRVRQRIPAGAALVTPLAAAAVAAAVLALGRLGPGPAVPATLVAAGAAVAVLTALRN